MAALVLIALLACAPHVAAEKTDLVVLDNGNELLGEIKSLARTKLRFKTDSAGTLSIEWDEIRRLTSEHRFRLELLDGTRLIGSFLAPPEDRALLLLMDDGTQRLLPMADVVRLTEFDRSAWERFDGYVKAGFSFTKASEVTQYSLGAGFSYFERVRSLSVDASAIITDQPDEDTAQNANLSAVYRRSFSRRWFLQGIGNLNHNTELGVDLRATAGIGPGRYLVQTQSQELSAFGGVAYSYEVPEGEPSDTEFEGVVGVNYDIFITDTPATILDLEWALYPGITQSDRLRSTVNLSLNKEFVEDLFWNVSYYLNYDSEPASVDGQTTDYGIVTGFSYTF